METERRLKSFCPLMREMCIGGWTKSMGMDRETGEKPTCVAFHVIQKQDERGKAWLEEHCVATAVIPTMVEGIAAAYRATAETQHLRNLVFHSSPPEVQRRALANMDKGLMREFLTHVHKENGDSRDQGTPGEPEGGPESGRP